MKKYQITLISFLVFAISFMLVLNMGSSTKKCIDYKCKEIKIPLYLKIIDYISRDLHYKRLVKEIKHGSENEGESANRILDWVNANIRKNPADLPVIDDHPLNIIIRGYGVGDQFEDVFTILCTYAGLGAFYKGFTNKEGIIFYLSFVEINKEWYPVSAYRHSYFLQNGKILSVNDIIKDPAAIADYSSRDHIFDSQNFLEGLKNMEFKVKSLRVLGQNPIKRLRYYLGRLVK